MKAKTQARHSRTGTRGSATFWIVPRNGVEDCVDSDVEEPPRVIRALGAGATKVGACWFRTSALRVREKR